MLRLAAVVCLLASGAVSAQKCAECGPAVHDAVGAAGYVIAVMHQATHVPGECHGPPAACVKNSPCELIWVLEIIVINPVPGGPYPPINVNSGGQNSTISYESEGLFQAVAYWSSGGGGLPCGESVTGYLSIGAAGIGWVINSCGPCPGVIGE